jgi:hypothetical protein
MIPRLDGFVNPRSRVRLRRTPDDYLDARQVALATDDATALHLSRVAYHTSLEGVPFVATSELADLLALQDLTERGAER